MKKILLTLLVVFGLAASGKAADRTTRVCLNTGLLYERGWEATLSAERETRYHNVWECFADLYLKWEKCPTCRHICPESFWHSYNTWNIGVAYKPMVFRTRNTTGNLRIGASIGSDTDQVIGGLHVGYEHNYKLRSGLVLFWQCKSDMILGGKDLFRTGASIGIKFPIK